MAPLSAVASPPDEPSLFRRLSAATLLSRADILRRRSRYIYGTMRCVAVGDAPFAAAMLRGADDNYAADAERFTGFPFTPFRRSFTGRGIASPTTLSTSAYIDAAVSYLMRLRLGAGARY